MRRTTLGDRLRAIYRRMTNVTWQYNPQLDIMLSSLPPGALACDLGAGGRRLSGRVLSVVCLEGTDVVADLHRLPFGDERFDCVVCTGTLEHVMSPQEAIEEIGRILKPGGLVYLEVPFLQGYHADPSDYWRWTLDGLELFCAANGFAKIRSGAHMGPSSVVTWVLRQYALCFVNGRSSQRLVFALVSLLLMPLKYLDVVLKRNVHFFAICSGFFFVGRKSSLPSSSRPAERTQAPRARGLRNLSCVAGVPQ